MVGTIVSPVAPKFVDLNGRQIKGRPITFDRKSVTRDFRDSKGEFIKPLKYESMCPFCCLRIEFEAGFKAIKCSRCSRGVNIPEHDHFPDPFCEPGQFDKIDLSNADQVVSKLDSDTSKDEQ